MTRYLLSNGVMTTDLVDYAIDYIKVYLLTNYNDVPYFQFGNTMDLTVNTRDEVIYQVRLAVNKSIAKLNTIYPELGLSLLSLSFNSMNNLDAILRINNQNINMRLTYEN